MKQFTRERKIELCKQIEYENIPDNCMTAKKIEEYYKNISDEKLNKFFREYYGMSI